jgi:hypothetical protein
VLIVLQALAGIAWGGVFLSGLGLVGGAGHHGREGLFVGVLFAILAVGAAGRLGLTLAGIPFSPEITLPLAAVLWLLGALLCVPWVRQSGRATSVG